MQEEYCDHGPRCMCHCMGVDMGTKEEKQFDMLMPSHHATDASMGDCSE